MSNTILAIIEMERFPQEVARRAAWVAQHYGCDLELVFSDPTVGFLRDSFMISADSKQMSDSLRQAEEEELEALAKSASALGIKVTTSILTDHPASDAIVAKAIEVDPRIVFKGTQYHSAAERATFKFVDWQLIHKLDYPLWLVKPHEWQEKPVIIAAVDPMHHHDKEGTLDQAIVKTGKELAAKCDGELRLVHTYDRLEAIGRFTKLRFNPKKVPVEEIEAQMRDEHQREIDALATRIGIDPTTVQMLPGRASEVLPPLARSIGADLVIMGAHARIDKDERIISSAAEQVLDHLHCDTLIAHPLHLA